MSEWKEYKLGDIAEINMGQSPDSKYYNNSGRGLPFLQGNRTFGLKYPTIDTYSTDAKKVAHRGDILFSVRAPVGDINVAHTDICIGRGLCSLRIKNGNNSFLYYLLHFIRKIIINAESGTVFGSVSKRDLENIEVYIPFSIDEQKQIASVLSSLDDKIDLLHRQNKTLEQIAETLFRQWFVEDAEDGWEKGTIEDEFYFTMGQSPPGATLNETGTGLIFYQGSSDFSFRFPNPRVYTTAPTRIANKYETLVSVRAPVGDINMAIDKCCLGRGVAAFRYKYDETFYSYTYYKLRSLMLLIKQFEDCGTVFGSIGKDDFKSIVNLIPPKRLIDEFQKSVRVLDDKVMLNSIQIRTLTNLRDTLLPKLMSGEIRLNLDSQD